MRGLPVLIFAAGMAIWGMASGRKRRRQDFACQSAWGSGLDA